MKIMIWNNGIELVREPDDGELHCETDVTRHMVRLLNERDQGCWERCRPDRIGITGCEQGVRGKKAGGPIYWHERYAVESANAAFNEGRVFYLKTD